MKILSRSFYAEILALQGFPAGLRASYFIRDKSGYPEFRNNQTFSIAGSRKGFGDPRGTLFFELARLAEARKPSYLLFENVPYALLHIRYIFKKQIRRLPGFSQSGQLKEQSAARISESSACSRDTERLVIPKFRITRVIPNKIRIPKPSRESLQRKDFCIRTSG